MSEVTKAQIEDLGAKLESFAKGLPKAERDVLGWILERASRGSGELSDEDMMSVAGGLGPMSMGNFERPTSALLARTVGGFQNPGDLAAIRISWSW
jgi:hypothetical protein